jgi:hypothetical protein
MPAMIWYGVLDLAFAALYAWVGFFFVPGRSPVYNLALGAVVGVLALAGLTSLLRARAARPVGIAASLVLLAFAGWVILGLVASSAYLRGVYGPLGKGMAALSLVIAAVCVEAFALLPLFQLRFLLRARPDR